VKRYAIQHPVSAYTFPKQARIERLRFDRDYLHVDLEDGRILSIPLSWIPTLEDASPQDREKYEINRDRTLVVWNPEKCGINDELRLADYLTSG
jgi:hypothetical protein